MVSVGQREQKWIWTVQTSVPRRMRTLTEKLHPFQGEKSSMTDMSLSTHITLEVPRQDLEMEPWRLGTKSGLVTEALN